jgi:hypothetical protein
MSLREVFCTYDSVSNSDKRSLSDNEDDNSSLFTSSFCNPYSDNKENSAPLSKKACTSFEVMRSEKLDFTQICQSLKNIQEIAFWSCSFMCHTWLTAKVIMSCRQNYLLIECSKGRDDWLISKLDEMELKNTKACKYSYFVEYEEEKKICCSTMWDFCYVVSPATRKRASCRRFSKNLVVSCKKIAKASRKLGNSEAAMFMAAWLKQFAETYGDKLPFSDWLSNSEIRLPFGTKKLVYEHYCSSILEDPTAFTSPLDCDCFVVIGKKDPTSAT